MAVSVPDDRSVGNGGHTADHNMIRQAILDIDAQKASVSDAVPKPLGVASAGSSPHAARADHVHAGSSGGGNFVVVGDLSDIPAGTPAGTVIVVARAVTGNQPPVAAFDMQPSGLTVAFDGSRSYALDQAAINSWIWDFGDGAAASGPTATHTYATPGTYDVRLTVQDVRGFYDYVIRSVLVDSSPATVAPVIVASRGTYLTTAGPTLTVMRPDVPLEAGDYVVVYLRGQSSSGISADVGIPQDFSRIGPAFTIPDSSVRYNGFFGRRTGTGEPASYAFTKPAGDTSRWIAVCMVVRNVDANPVVTSSAFGAKAGLTGSVTVGSRRNSLALFAFATESGANNSGALVSASAGIDLVNHTASNLASTASNSWVHVYSDTVTDDTSSVSASLTLAGPALAGFNGGAVVLRGLVR
jgi:PKD repeat protein